MLSPTSIMICKEDVSISRRSGWSEAAHLQSECCSRFSLEEDSVRQQTAAMVVRGHIMNFGTFTPFFGSAKTMTKFACLFEETSVFLPTVVPLGFWIASGFFVQTMVSEDTFISSSFPRVICCLV